MADSYTLVPNTPGGNKIDESSLAVNGEADVRRQRNVIADSDVAAALARVTNGVPTAADYALVARLATSNLHIGQMGGETIEASASFTRPANTTPYAANDAVNNSAGAPSAMEFTVARVASGSGYITKARIVTNVAIVAPQLRLWLFNAAAPAQDGDNVAAGVYWANRASMVGYIDFPYMATEGASGNAAHALTTDVRLPFIADASMKLYGILFTRTAFTPTSAQEFYVSLAAEQN